MGNGIFVLFQRRGRDIMSASFSGGGSMEFHVNHPILFLLAGILIAVVLAQSVFFLVKALRRSRELGMDQTKIKKTIKRGFSLGIP